MPRIGSIPSYLRFEGHKCWEHANCAGSYRPEREGTQATGIPRACIDNSESVLDRLYRARQDPRTQSYYKSAVAEGKHSSPVLVTSPTELECSPDQHPSIPNVTRQGDTLETWEHSSRVSTGKYTYKKGTVVVRGQGDGHGLSKRRNEWGERVRVSDGLVHG